MPSRPIHQILSDRPFVGVSADTPVREVVRQMNALQRSAALVTEHGVLTGIFTERDAAFGVLAAGLDALGDLDGLDDDAVTAKLEEVQAEPFFRLVHSTSVVALYDDHEVWQLLGYEGSSFEKGGYLHRGFDDLDWLPEVRIEEYDGEPRVEIVKGA